MTTNTHPLSHTTGDVERVLGRSARDFFSYAQRAASAWKVAS